MNKLIAIVGMSGSGKGVACEFLEKKGFQNIYFGGVVLEEVKKRGLELTHENEKIVREDLRKTYGMSAMADILLPKIQKSVEEVDTVLDGLYSWDEYVRLIKEFPNQLKLVAIIVDKKTRYNRVSKREFRPLNREEIIKRDIAEIENSAKGGPIAYADYYIDNSKTIDEFEEQLERVLKDIEEGENQYEKDDKQ